MNEDDDRLRLARARWRYTGQHPPDFAAAPSEGQESVWEYPRPPIMVPDRREVEVRALATVIARTRRAVRVLETASPPTFYLPPDDVLHGFLRPWPGDSVCEWKGRAVYWSVEIHGRSIAPAGWSYPAPFPEYRALAGWLSFYPARLACKVEGEPVTPQPGGFYGGWVTGGLSGPFKGEPGTEWW